MFYEIHILDNDIFQCEADDCQDPLGSEMIERVWHDEDGQAYYAIQHEADWAAEEAQEIKQDVLRLVSHTKGVDAGDVARSIQLVHEALRS